MKDWAVLAKTIVATASSVEVGVGGQGVPLARHAMERGGAMLFSLSEAAPDCSHMIAPGAAGPVLHAVVADVSNVTHPQRVRGVVRISGRTDVLDDVEDAVYDHLQVPHGGRVGRLFPEAVSLEWDVERGAAPRPPLAVDAASFAEARVDALGGWQDGWIAHLDRHHRESLRELVVGQVQPVSVLRPVYADEDGLVLREYIGTCRRDLRVPFPSKVRCGCEATQALKDLFAVVGAQG